MDVKGNDRMATRIFGLSLTKKRDSEFVMSATKSHLLFMSTATNLPSWGAEALAEKQTAVTLFAKPATQRKSPFRPKYLNNANLGNAGNVYNRKDKRKGIAGAARVKMFRAPRGASLHQIIN